MVSVDGLCNECVGSAPTRKKSVPVQSRATICHAPYAALAGVAASAILYSLTQCALKAGRQPRAVSREPSLPLDFPYSGQGLTLARLPTKNLSGG